MRAETNQMVQELAGLLKDRAAVLVSYQGLTANALNGFRAKIADPAVGGTVRVAKNTLIKKAAAQLGYDGLANCELNGDTAFLTGPDAVALVKTVKAFIAASGKDNKVNVKVSFVEGQLLNDKETLALADLPSKEVVLAQLLGLIQAPASGIARALNAGVAQVLYALNAYKEKLEKEQTA